MTGTPKKRPEDLLRHPVKIEIGAVYGYLTVVGLGHEDPVVQPSGRVRRRRAAVCRCVCGVEKTIVVYNLVNGDARSCGCRQEERDPPEVLFAKNVVVRADGCHEWTGQKDKDGYGKFQITTEVRKQKHVRAHRYAYFLKHGTWPSQLALHSCDRPWCVNPDHLSDGSQSENIQQCVARGRHNSQRERTS